MTNRPLEVFERIRSAAPRVAVIGDFLLDGWWSGHVERLAREAPAPVVEIDERITAPGGAANTAVNLAALGAEVTAVGIIGDDPAGAELRGMLEADGVHTEGLAAVAGRRTIVKNRVVSADQLLLRIDEGSTAADPHSVERFVAGAYRAADESDAVLLCDYGSPAMAALAADPRLSRLGFGRLRVVDAHEPARWRRLRPDAVTPNAAEAQRMLGEAVDGVERATFFAEHADRLRRRTGASTVVVTMDREGALALTSDAAYRTHAHPAPEKLASGGGDTFAAAFTLALASGASIAEASEIGQAAADVAVHKDATSVCSAAELEAWLGRLPDAALSADVLLRELEHRRLDGQRVVFTNGCFDVLHRGHTSYLRQAKRLGDVLVVAINGDDSVRRLKGPDRPINGAVDRANVLAALECVDYVTVFDEDTPRELIARLRPDVYVKGGDYTPEMLAETETVRSVGGEVVIVDYVPEYSTSAVVHRIRSAPVGERG